MEEETNLVPPTVAPILSTPDSRIFDEPLPVANIKDRQLLDDVQLSIAYEVDRTVREIREGGWKRVALQFPDHMLVDAPRVYQALSRGLILARKEGFSHSNAADDQFEKDKLPVNEGIQYSSAPVPTVIPERLFVLADTSYGSCCVDEVAAEHADADCVVHYGRTCLSATSRLPVIYVFTKPVLDTESLADVFQRTYSNKSDKIILTADVPFMSYLPDISRRLKELGYDKVFTTELIGNPSSPLPNRTVPGEAASNTGLLKDYQLFHVAEPPESLLLILSSVVGEITIYNVESKSSSTGSAIRALQRRYAVLTSLSTTPIFGILINTLSVRNYQQVLAHVKQKIADAGKKSYTFVVGKVNAAKVANFSEVGGWVVIGCWESSLFDSKNFWKPIITPFELELALQSDSARVWTGSWRSDFQSVLSNQTQDIAELASAVETSTITNETSGSEDESAPPEYDLRTGRYVSNTRPMQNTRSERMAITNGSGETHALTKRARGDLAQIGNQVSPAAEFFKTNRSWKGLGSDFTIDENNDSHGSDERRGARVEQGRSGVARGYAARDGNNKT